MSIFKNADSLKSLPTDDEELSLKEKTVVDMLYPEDEDNDEDEIKEKSNKKDKKDKKEEKEKSNKNLLEPSKSLNNAAKDIEKTWFHFNDIIVATMLFILLNIPISDRLIEKIVKIDNFYYRLAAKSAVFAILLFFINNFALARKKSL
jgi:hypothetical protein